MRIVCHLLALLATCAVSKSLAVTQSQPSGDTLKRASEFALAYSRSIPKFRCNEAIHSEQRAVNGAFVRQMDTKGTMEVKREELNQYGLPEEERKFFEVNKRSVIPGEKVTLPYTLYDAYAPAPKLFFSTEKQSCYIYSSARGRITFRTNDEVVGQGNCKPPYGTSGFATFDNSMRVITHIERTLPDSQTTDFAKYASLDYAPVSKNGKLYMLPSRIYARQPWKGMIQVFDARYSNCQIFGGSAVILPFSPSDIVDNPASPIPPQ